MKRLFLLIPVLALSLMAGAKTINITPTSPKSSDNLRRALDGAADGDIIEMAAGTYVESPSNYIAFDGKHVTVRAAEGAEVLIQPQVPITIANGGCAHFENVKIDASHLKDINDWYTHSIYPSDASDNNRIILEGCEMYDFNLVSSAIYCSSANKLDSVSFNNCYFHNMMKSVLFIESTAGTGVHIANSTFANIEKSSSYDAGVIDTRATSGSFSVDHCTFYNCQVKNTDYGTIGKVTTPGAVVSNCIFAMPESTADLRAIRDVATANNCLTYNYTKDSNWGIHSSVTKNNCIQLKDPLFTDAANGDFSFANNWVTMSISPACGAATDGSDLGDPRWYSDPVVPSSNFASPGYTFLGTKAQLSGSFALNGDNYIQSQNTTTAGVAIWKIEATRKCIVGVTLNIASANTSGHLYEVALYDADNALVGSALAEEKSWSAGDKVLGTLEIPAAGIYTVKLTNSCDYSSTIIEGVKFLYVGGAVQNMPGTTAIADAWFSSNGTRADGKISYSSISSGCWAKWNIAVASAGTYNVTVNISGQYGHKYVVEFLKEGESTPIVVTKGETNYDNDATLYANELGSVALEAANYEMKVFNDVGDAALHSVTLAYAGGAVVNIPNNNIPLTEAILADGATRDGDGLHFKNAQYVKWNIHATEGLYTFTAHCTSPSTEDYSNLMIKVKQGNTELYSYAPQYHYNQADKEIQSPEWLLDAGDYTLELSNPTSGNGYLTSLAATAPSNMFILDDNKTDDGSIAAAAEAGTSYKFLLKRSFTAGRYYTICIPVGSWNDELKLAFGADYELWKMTSAEQNGDAIDLNFEQINGQSFHAGWPYIIKPSVDVQNPVLYNEKTIANSTYNNTQSFDAADFIGTFYKSEIPAGENNLYLQNNNLYYSESSNTTIKGTRAWIRLKQQGAAPARARIVMGGKVATDINLVNGELVNGTVKAIENGQLILIRDGKKYNVMGARLQ